MANDKSTPVPAKVQAEMNKGVRQRYALGTCDLPKGDKK
jgi:hypothetical protein